MRLLTRFVVPLVVTMFAATVGCAPSIFADTHLKCPLGQTDTNGSCEDYSQPSDMREFTRQVFDSISAFAAANDVSAPSLGSLNFGMPNDERISPCTGMPGGVAYDACFADGEFYMGADMLFPLYESSNTLAPVTVIAHEYGHFLQEAAGLTHDDSSPGDITTVRLENQADCVSGAFISWLETEQQVKLADLLDLLDMIWQHGSNPYMEPFKIHGTPPERTKSFTTGYDGGLDACNDVGNGSIT